MAEAQPTIQETPVPHTTSQKIENMMVHLLQVESESLAQVPPENDLTNIEQEDVLSTSKPAATETESSAVNRREVKRHPSIPTNTEEVAGSAETPLELTELSAAPIATSFTPVENPMPTVPKKQPESIERAPFIVNLSSLDEHEFEAFRMIKDEAVSPPHMTEFVSDELNKGRSEFLANRKNRTSNKPRPIIGNIPSPFSMTMSMESIGSNFSESYVQDKTKVKALAHQGKILESEYLGTEQLETPKGMNETELSHSDKTYDFERLDELARGGFGVVYKVVDNISGKYFAQKVLEVESLKDGTAKRQFIREAKVLFMCPKHPHIIRMIDTCHDREAKEYVITLELAVCGSVKDYFAGRIPLTEELSACLIKQILLGIEHLHENNIIYRDLKLSNILLVSERHLKLADFGISKVFDDIQLNEDEDFGKQLKRLSQSGLKRFNSGYLAQALISKEESEQILATVAEEEPSEEYDDVLLEEEFPTQPARRTKTFVGTKYYQPPEMLQREGHSFKMDVWSTGIIAWQMLFGGMPFLLRDKKQIKRIMKKGLRFPRSVDVSEECKDFVQRCLLLEEERMSVFEALDHPWIADVVIDV